MVKQSMYELEFEKPLIELRKKLHELKNTSLDLKLDFSEEILSLENRIKNIEQLIYDNLKTWDRVQLSRHPMRPTTLDYINTLCTDFFECKGDRLFGEDPAIIGGVAKYHGTVVTVIGHQRGKDTKENILRNFGMAQPEGFRKALRLMKQAEKFHRPIISFIDTKGAYPGKAAEEHGQSEAIARNLYEMSRLNVPIICVVIGEGGSGGALALGVGDRILMLENSTYSVISPEGAASILWRDSAQAKRAADSMKMTAEELKKLNLIDVIIPEIRGGAHCSIKNQAKLVDDFLYLALNEVIALSDQDRLEQRYQKFRNIGQYTYKNNL